MFEKIKTIIVENLGVDASKVTEDATFEDLGADSLSVVQVIMDLEEKFNLTVEEDELNNFHTVGDIVKYAEKHVK